MAVSAHLKNVRHKKHIINETFPNGQITVSRIEGELYITMLPSNGRQAHILPNIEHSLVSVGAIFDAGCAVKFRINDVTVV